MVVGVPIVSDEILKRRAAFFGVRRSHASVYRQNSATQVTSRGLASGSYRLSGSTEMCSIDQLLPG